MKNFTSKEVAQDLPPVDPKKIELINNLLNDSVVQYFYLNWVKIQPITQNFSKRESAFKKYAESRDKFLGFIK